jgi:sarcosine oxidase subunit alpha
MTPADAGLEWAIGKAKKDFVGKRSLRRPDMIVPNRKQLVGLLTDDAQIVLEEGAQIVAKRGETKAIGHVTSAYKSPALGRSIALAVVEAGRSRMGEALFVRYGDAAIPVSVTDPIFYDKKGTRLDG